ncbi:acyl carrier protein [Bacteroides sedimenti]|uniref:Carrier domain-containing protein n=1 Tax=Bacteroides sedimenti TaxID=2136147 RepID=A0ABM8IDA4_9BACE
MEVEKKVKEIVAQICETDAAEIKPSTSIGDYPQWDSVGHISILSALEDFYNINFEGKEMVEIEDVADMINAVKRNLKID